MNNDYFKGIEQNKLFKTDFKSFIQNLNFNNDGLIPAIAQSYTDKTVLMMAWMNQTSIKKTLESLRVCYWSRSRKKYWYKGEESGNIQQLVSMSVDCDGDTLLLKVKQKGSACHTNQNSCFFWKFDQKQNQIIFETNE